MSNAKDIIRKLKAGSYDDDGVDQAFTTLKSEILGCLPEKRKMQNLSFEPNEDDVSRWGYNQALTDVTTAIVKYLGGE